MPDTAKLFMNGRSQAVRLPRAFRFECEEVFIRRDPETGDVIISEKPGSWDGFLELLAEKIPLWTRRYNGSVVDQGNALLQRCGEAAEENLVSS